MHGPRGTADPVDNVRRDAKDGAYHCPQCETPFTRRSNLRRHFQIHTRNAIQKCESCDEEFHSKLELQQHAGSCYSLPWNSNNEKAFRGLDPSLISDGSVDPANINSNAGTLNAFLYGTNYNSSATLFPAFEDSRYANAYGASDFITPLSSPMGVLPTHTTSSSLDGSLGSLNSSLGAFSQTRRPSSSSSGSISSSSTSPSPFSSAANIAQTHTNGFPTVQTNFGQWNRVQSSPVTPIDEYAIYTRQQVKEMIDVVGECLIDTMENVITRSSPTVSLGIPFDNVESQLVQNMRDAGFRQTVISEAMPRVFYKMQSRNEQKVLA